MTREQAKKKLISLGIGEPTEEQVNNYLDSIDVETKRYKSKADTDKEEIERLKIIEAEYEAEKEKSMTAEERAKKAEEAIAKAEKEANDKAAEFARKISRLSVVSVFEKAGISEEEYVSFIDGLVGEDEEASKERANALVNLLSSRQETQKASLEQEFEEKLKNYTPNPGGVGGGANRTKAQELASKAAKDRSEANDTKILDHYRR